MEQAERIIEEVCKDADIILTANSQAECFEDYPYVKGEYLKEGAVVIVTSALRVEKSFCNDNENVVCIADDCNQYKENRTIDVAPVGETESITFKNALHDNIVNNKKIYDLSDIVNNSNFKRDKSKIYMFASGGSPLEDVAWATECYNNAIENNIGVKLPVWKENTKL